MNEFLTCSFALGLTSTEVESATLTATWALDFGGHFRIYMWPVACLLWWRNPVCVAMRSAFSSCLQQVCQPIFLLMWWLKETGSTTLATPSFRCFLVWDELLRSQFVEGFCRDRSSPNSMTCCCLLVLPCFQHCQRLYEVAIFLHVFPKYIPCLPYFSQIHTDTTGSSWWCSWSWLPLPSPCGKPCARVKRTGPRMPVPSSFTIFWGTVSAGALAFFVRGFTGDTDIVTQTFQEENVSKWIQFYAPVLRHTPLILVHVGGTLFLSLLAAMVCRDENTGMIGWVLLAFSYMQMVVIPWDQDSFAHLVNLNIVGMVTFQWSPGLDWWLMVTNGD